MATLGAAEADTVYVGDSEVDVTFARNTGLPMVIVDQWTLLMGVIAAAAIVIKVFSHKKVEEKAEAEA